MENNCEAEGICQRLFNFLVDVFLSGGLKRVTLGRTSDSHTIGVQQNGAASIEFNSLKTIGNIADKVQHSSPDNEGTREVKIEHLQATGLPMKDEIEIQEEGFVVSSIHRSMFVPTDQWTTIEYGTTNGITSDGSTNGTIVLTNGSQASSSGTKSEGRCLTKKMVSTEEEALEREMLRKKEKNKAVMEETLAPEAMLEKDAKMKAPSHSIPILLSAFNIDQRSDELIRRTREALRSSSSIEA